MAFNVDAGGRPLFITLLYQSLESGISDNVQYAAVPSWNR